MENKERKDEYISVAELAQMLGISRIAVFKKIQKEQIPAKMVGHSYIISMTDINNIYNSGKKKLITDKKNVK